MDFDYDKKSKLPDNRRKVKISSGRCSLKNFTAYEDLLISIQTAGVYNGGKDKRGEKLAESDEDRLESRTDGSDAFDTVVIGCERFPQQTVSLAVTSSF